MSELTLWQKLLLSGLLALALVLVAVVVPAKPDYVA